MNLTVLGGGGARMPAFVRAVLAGRPGMFGEIRLFEPDPLRRETTCRLAAEVAAALGRPGVVRVTADAAEALTGADYVFSAIRVGGDRGRVIDEQVALRRGIVGQETTGPGGAAMALRTIPAVLAYCDLISRCAPDAALVNFTNPAGLITQAISGQGKVRVVGVCDTPAGTLSRLAAFLGMADYQVSGSYAGLNHLGWVCAVRPAAGGDGGGSSSGAPGDRLPELLERFPALQRADHLFAGFDPALVRRVGAIPTEYVYFYYDPRRYLDSVARAGASRGADVERLNAELLGGLARAFADGGPAAAWRAYATVMAVRSGTYLRAEMRGDSGQAQARARQADAAPAAIAAAELGGYEAVALRVIDGLAGHGPSEVIVNVAAGAALGLDPGDVVEIPARVDGPGVTPLAVPVLPRSAQALVAQVKEYERTLIEAALSGDAGLAAVALALHPLVPGITAARELIATYRDLHRPHLDYLR